MKFTILIFSIFLLSFAAVGIAQPPTPKGPPGAGAPPRTPPPMGQNSQGGPQRPGDWIRPHDTNDNGILEQDEFQAAIERTFLALDKNANGSLEREEIRPKSPPQRPPIPPGGQQPAPPKGPAILPPFFLANQMPLEQTITRSEFDRIVRSVFSDIDENGDGALSIEETQKHRPPQANPPPRPPGAPMPPSARFIESTMRFGDRLVTAQPFSAKTVIEETRRLFDGTTAKNERSGAIYRDSQGRTRREQPLEVVAGVRITGSDRQIVRLIFINDFPGRSQYSLDQNNKIARKSPIWSNRWPFPEEGSEDKAKTESLGTKVIEGIKAEGTRVTFEIPTGQIGNEKPLLVITERWFSPELQIVILSRHVDPIAGEHVFRLVDISRQEPAADLFRIPAGYRIENVPPVRN